MFIFNISNPLTLLLMLAATVLLIFLAQEVKKSAIVAIPLFVYLAILVIHVIQFATLSEEFNYLSIKPYIYGKLLHGVIAAIYTFIAINTFPFFNFNL